jgi:hypothetical protein
MARPVLLGPVQPVRRANQFNQVKHEDIQEESSSDEDTKSQIVENRRKLLKKQSRVHALTRLRLEQELGQLLGQSEQKKQEQQNHPRQKQKKKPRQQKQHNQEKHKLNM